MKQRGFTRQAVAPASVADTVDQIQTQTNALLALSATGGTATATGQEQTLYIDDEPLGCWHPIALFVDLDNMLLGDTIILRAYYRLRDGGALQLWDAQSFSGADGSLANGAKIVDVALKPNRHGFRLTLEQSAGTMRDYDWELLAEI
jgi:hypothetical protein